MRRIARSVGSNIVRRSASMVTQDQSPNADNNPPQQGRLGTLAFSLLDSLLHRGTPLDRRPKNSKVSPQYPKKPRNSRSVNHFNAKSRREPRSRREGASRREGNSGRERSSNSSTPNVAIRRSSSAKLLRKGWSTKALSSKSLRQSSSSRSFNPKVAVNDGNTNEPPEVVTNYVYDVPDKKPKQKIPIPGSDYDDHDEQENDDVVHDLDGEEEVEEEDDEFDLELRPFMSEDEDEMAYFAHRMGGSDFKLLRRHVLHPHGRIRSIWDTVLLVLTTWILIIVPFELCFSMSDSVRRSVLHLDLFVDAVFAVDIALNFNTAIEDDGKLHFSFNSIFRHYTHGWFIPEVLWTLPFYAMFESHDPEVYAPGGSAAAPLFRFAAQRAWLYPTARCLRLLRVVGLPRLQRRLEYSLLISSKVSSLGSFLFVVMALSHVFSCVFAYLAFDDGEQLNFAIEMHLLQDEELKTRYIAAFYWSMMTMTTVGYGDIMVKTNSGRMFAIAAMVVGAGVFAYGITNVVSLFQQLYEDDTAYRRDMDQINAFMEARMLPRTLRDKVRANTFHWRKAARGENKERDRAIVERMASLIRVKVADRFCEDMMPYRMPFLAGCSSEFIHDLYLRMRVQCYLPGEDIISQGDYGSEMYFLFVGHAQVLLGLTKVALFGPNSCFGEFSIANPRKPRLATIQALDFCETHCIDREQILRVLIRHPTTLRSTRQLAALRSRKALTLIYESSGKSRTLLQGLAMLWRAEGMQGVLPAGVTADSLPLLQEFTMTPAVAPTNARRSSLTGSITLPASGVPQGQFQLHQLHPQQQLDQSQLLQLQQFASSMASQSLTPSASSISTTPLTPSGGTHRRHLITVDAAVTASREMLLSPSRGRSESAKMSAVTIEEGPMTSTAPLVHGIATLRKNVHAADFMRAKPVLKRRGSTSSITIGSPLVVLPPITTEAPSNDRIDQLLTEIRNIASRQHALEQQLKTVLENTYAKTSIAYPEADNLRLKTDSGITAAESGRFDEQRWINRQTSPRSPVRRASNRHLDRSINPISKADDADKD